MADFVQVANELNRMCVCFGDGCHDRAGDTCPFASVPGIGLESTDCYIYAIDHPDESQKLVMRWAEAHPAPKYPTWEEVLRQIGVITGAETTFELYKREISPIHAARLGIEPIEGK